MFAIAERKDVFRTRCYWRFVINTSTTSSKYFNKLCNHSTTYPALQLTAPIALDKKFQEMLNMDIIIWVDICRSILDTIYTHVRIYSKRICNFLWCLKINNILFSIERTVGVIQNWYHFILILSDGCVYHNIYCQIYLICLNMKYNFLYKIIAIDNCV